MSKLNFKKISIVLAVVLCFFFSSHPIEAVTDNGYQINSYDVDITVNEDNSYDIVETIEADFYGPNKHGIIRSIPLHNDIIREDGSTGSNNAKVSNVTVNDTFSASFENGMYKLKIGSGDRLVSGKVTYVISYTYSIGRDPLPDADEFYFNIVGDSWDVPISNITFSVHFPKEFKYSQADNSLGFSTKYSHENTVMFKVDHNTVYGTFDYLNAYEPLTMRVVLPNGYFIYEPSFFEVIREPLSLISIVVAAIAMVLKKFFKGGIVDPINFYPPDNLNLLDVGYYYDDKLDSKDVIATLLYLAGKGYLTINDPYSKGDYISSPRTFDIHLHKYPENEDDFVKIFYNGLSKRGTQITDDDIYVSFKQLEYRFYPTINSIKSDYLSSLRLRPKVYESLAPYRIFFSILGISTFISIILSVITKYSAGILFEIVPVLFSIFIFIIAVVRCVVSTAPSLKTMKDFLVAVIATPIVIALFFLIGIFGQNSDFGVRLLKSMVTLIQDNWILILGCIASLSLFISASSIKKYSAFGKEVKGNILGFRRFLETAEKPQLEMLVEENPNYFFDILPYTWQLGISDKWVKKFETLGLMPKTWGDSLYSRDVIHNLDYSMRSFESKATSEYRSTSSWSSSSGSGSWSSSSSSGGGFSGGGSGGGGGSSW